MTFGARRTLLIKTLTVALLGFALLLPAPGAAAQGPEALARLIEALARTGKSTAGFTEERHLAYLTEPVTLEGRLTFEPPGRLERQVTSPKRERMVIEGRLLIIERNAKDPPTRVLLSDHPPLEAFVSALRALLSGDRDGLQALFETELTSGESAWRLRLTPRAPLLRQSVEEIRVAGAADRINRIEVAETSGNRTVVTLEPAS